MPEHDAVQKALAELAKVRDNPTSPESVARLVAALGHDSYRVVAQAAQLARELGVAAVVPRMPAAFDRFMIDGAERDPQCRAKLALVEALRDLRYPAPRVFHAGARYVQRELDADGSTVDTAGELRGNSVMALLAGGYRGGWLLAAETLADADVGARLGAIEAIDQTGNITVGVPLLRLKARSGDDNVQVMSACLRALASLDPESSLEFVQTFLLDPSEHTREAAALALGESRLASAFEPLREFCQRSPDMRRIGLMAIAMLRTDQAWQHLLDLVSTAAPDVSRDALEALLLYRRDPGLRERIIDALTRRGKRYLFDLFAKLQDDDPDDQ